MSIHVGRLSGAGRRLLPALGVNSVPAVGFLGQGWSTGTTLVLYWLETVLVIALVAVRIVMHRRLTRKAGHWNIPVVTTIEAAGKTTTHHGKTTFLAASLGPMTVFTAGHGLLLALLLFLPDPDIAAIMAGVSLGSLAAALPVTAAFLGIGFLMDLRGLEDRPFRWIERLARHVQGRMIVTQATLVFGMIAMAVWETPTAFFAVFVGFKMLMDLSGLLPEQDEMVRIKHGLGPSEALLRSREAKEHVIDEGPAGGKTDAGHNP